MDSEGEDRGERGGDGGRGPVAPPRGADEPGEEREAPGDEQQRPGEPRLHPELGVVRLTCLQLDAEALCRGSGIAQPVSVRVLHRRLDPVSEAVQVAANRRLAEADGAAQAAALR